MLPTPLLNSVKKGTRHLNIVNKVNPTKTHAALLPTLVCLLVDYRCYTTYHLAVFIGKEILGFAELKSGILVLRQRGYFVAMQIGHIIFVAAIKVIMELYERL